jgi:RimJ/RimL family protein N-acetyltransferase
MGNGKPHLVGDVNLYLTKKTTDDDDDDDDGSGGGDKEPIVTAEIDVMIAEPNSRRQGFAREAVSLMMRHALDDPSIQLTSFYAKINDDNEASLALFASLGFIFHSHSDLFAQTTLTWTASDESRAALNKRSDNSS